MNRTALVKTDLRTRLAKRRLPYCPRCGYPWSGPMNNHREGNQGCLQRERELQR